MTTFWILSGTIGILIFVIIWLSTKLYKHKSDKRLIIDGKEELTIKGKEELTAQSLKKTIKSSEKRTKIKPIQSFELTSNEDSSASLKFERILKSVEPVGRTWKPISLDKSKMDTFSNFLSSAGASGAQTGYMAYTLKGLFRATADPETLMKMKSNIRPEVMEKFLTGVIGADKKIVKHAPFIRAGASFLTPLVVFQVLSIIVGMNYMKTINKQLNRLQKGINKLIQFFHVERTSKLQAAFDKLREFSKSSAFEVEDFSTLENIKHDLKIIQKEYLSLFQTSCDSITRLTSEDIGGNDLIKSFEEENIISALDMVYSTDNLLAISKIVELHMNISLKNPSLDRLKKTEELIKKIKQYDVKIKTSYTEFNKKRRELEGTIIGHLNERKEGFFVDNDIIEDLKSGIESKFKKFREDKKAQIEGIQSMYKEIRGQLTAKKDMLLDTRSGTPVLYIQQKNA